MATPQNTNAQKYDWDEWMVPGYEWTIYKGQHYSCMTHGMMGQIRNQAHKRGLNVSIASTTDSITFTVYK